MHRYVAPRSWASPTSRVLLAAPVGLVFWRTFEHGLGAGLGRRHDTRGDARVQAHGPIALIAVPANTVFGVICALAIVRRRFPGKGIVNALVDLPLALSPVVVGLALCCSTAATGWFGGWLTDHGIQVIFAFPGWFSRRSSSRSRSSCARSSRCSARSAPSRSRPRRRSAPRRSRRSGASRCPRSAGPWATASC